MGRSVEGASAGGGIAAPTAADAGWYGRLGSPNGKDGSSSGGNDGGVGGGGIASGTYIAQSSGGSGASDGGSGSTSGASGGGIGTGTYLAGGSSSTPQSTIAGICPMGNPVLARLNLL